MRYEVALIPGDRIGMEVTPEGVQTLEVLAGECGFEIAMPFIVTGPSSTSNVTDFCVHPTA